MPPLGESVPGRATMRPASNAPVVVIFSFSSGVTAAGASNVDGWICWGGCAVSAGCAARANTPTVTAG
jgi:hypothetical protein